MLKADGFDDCIIGVGSRCAKPDILIYDVEKIIMALIADGMSREEAEDYFDFNIQGAWMGEETPIFMSPYEPDKEQPDDEFVEVGVLEKDPWPNLIP